MRGLQMDIPLMISAILQHAAQFHGSTEIVAREIDGIGFKTADRIAINLGFANDAPPRLDAGLLYALETLQDDGHTAFPHDDLVGYAANLLETSSEFITARIAARGISRSATAPAASSVCWSGSTS